MKKLIVLASFLSLFAFNAMAHQAEMNKNDGQMKANKMEKWILMEEVYPEPPEKAMELVDWFTKVRMPDVVSREGFKSAKLYEAGLPEVITGRGKYMAMYFIETDDIEKTMQLWREKEAEAKEKGRMTDLAVFLWRDVLYKFMTERDSGKKLNKKEHWIVLTETNADPKRVDAYNDWYNNIHLPDALETPDYVSARRYFSDDVRDGRGKYFSVYEVETDDMDKTMDSRKALIAKQFKAGRSSDTYRRVWGFTLYKLIAEVK
ncbi:hypothetical protein [Thiolapillus sp.]